MPVDLPPQASYVHLTSASKLAALGPYDEDLAIPIPKVQVLFGGFDRWARKAGAVNACLFAGTEQSKDITAREATTMTNQIPVVERELVARFNEIGRHGGRLVTPDERKREYGFWQAFGEEGARWLIQRAHDARGLAQMWGIAGILESMGPVAVNPAIETLAAGPSNKVADMLLSALGGMAPDRITPWVGVIAATLRTYLCHGDDAVRTKAVGATAALPAAVSIGMLRDRLPLEADPDVREAIQDEIERRS